MSEETTNLPSWQVYGHDWAVEHLQKVILFDRVRHAYLISGVEAIGKMQLALSFAMALLCEKNKNERPCGECPTCRRVMKENHPDLLYPRQDEQTGVTKIDAIREVMQQLALAPYDARYRIAIFQNFDQIQPRAQDALLKTIEEPSPQVILLLLANTTETILPTILSRVQHLHLRPVSYQTIESSLEKWGIEPDTAHLIARLSNGRIGWALEATKDDSILDFRLEMIALLQGLLDENRAGRFKIAEQFGRKFRRDKPGLRLVLQFWLTYWRDILLLVKQSPVKPCNIDQQLALNQLAQSINEAEAKRALTATQNSLRLLNTNANLRQLIEVLLLDYPGLTA